MITDTQRIDKLEEWLCNDGYPIQLQSGTDDTIAHQIQVTITTGINSGPYQRIYKSPPGGITLRSALDTAIKQS